MLISEPMFAAAYKTPQADARVFDDIGCLLEAASHEQDKSGLRFWFHDAATSRWIDGGIATFVESASMRTPMGAASSPTEITPPPRKPQLRSTAG
jgi:hypothetical protein